MISNIIYKRVTFIYLKLQHLLIHLQLHSGADLGFGHTGCMILFQCFVIQNEYIKICIAFDILNVGETFLSYT